MTATLMDVMPDGKQRMPIDGTHLQTRRVQFLLSQDEYGYPPASGETVWATDLGQGTYRIDNIPFFATGVSLGDVIEAETTDGLPTFERVLKRGGHSTLRVVAFGAASIAGLRTAIAELGCATELSHIPTLIAVDVPPSASLEALRDYLQAGSAQGRWDVEEADVPA